ncbi:cell invasion LPXTG protein Vip [Listeria monocytogenes]|uniref:Cell invasion LPXTG protein Vip n=5 Tax=Listeria monocytogenes TaxID=1639 RepID=A0AAN3BT45_LISMN|nr:cell invasion LPXTG protein Vip [Listeria monocytogenes]EAG6351316.1 cell invasion LPXTG protein Vip [Listeria monocytogenes LIS0102]EHA8950965.1 cell invasion LPXTG protein Vip [Listeria monocytogenes serotype 4b]AAT03124.1 cell wall surface anchor family protein [Listeria monocytogenes serotype 4b str. F2365]EAA0320377.1 cell invasion LPXTG protein Vip [Listeria monocytogenes]EAC2226206.1 cell invasion LPXTG protein Vip [Listeria monocytogenes]
MNKYFKNLATVLFTVSLLTTSITALPAMASAYEETHYASTIYISPLDAPHVGDTKITGKTTALSSFAIAIYTPEGRLTGTFFGTTNAAGTYAVDLSDFTYYDPLGYEASGNVILEKGAMVRSMTETNSDLIKTVTINYNYIQTAINELFLNNDPTGTILAATDQNAINAVQEQINTVTSSEKETFQEQLNNAQQQLDARIAQEQAAIQAVNQLFLEDNPANSIKAETTQDLIDQAQTLVDVLPASELKDTLQANIVKAQTELDERSKPVTPPKNDPETDNPEEPVTPVDPATPTPDEPSTPTDPATPTPDEPSTPTDPATPEKPEITTPENPESTVVESDSSENEPEKSADSKIVNNPIQITSQATKTATKTATKQATKQAKSSVTKTTTLPIPKTGDTETTSSILFGTLMLASLALFRRKK